MKAALLIHSMYIMFIFIYIVLIWAISIRLGLVERTRLSFSKIHVSSSFGHLKIDSVLAPHDEIYVSRQQIHIIQISLRNVYGTVNLHGAAISFSLVFVTMG